MIKQIRILSMLLISGLLLSFPSCKDEDIVDNIYTFTEQTMGQYVDEDNELSEFSEVLRRTHIDGLLKAYGELTCFAPDNEAMKAYYEKKGKTSINDFTVDELKTVAYDHLINGYAIPSSSFITGRLNQQTMGDRYISISYNDNNTYVNNTSMIYDKDILVHNGVIHKITSVIDPTRFGIVEAISKDEKFTLFYDALLATGLSDSLMKDVDKNYDPNKYTDLIVYPKESNPAWRLDDIPWARKYGYTVFMESNETMNKAGITDLESMKTYAAKIYDAVYPENKGISDITNRKNSLNRFIAYHLVNKELSLTKLIDAYDNPNQVKTVDMYEYLEPFCPNTLIEIKKDRTRGESNLINHITDTGREVRITDNYDNDAANGVYHELNDMLVYDVAVRNEHASKRLRFDTASLFPELTNNNFRGYVSTIPCPHIWFPRGYLDRVESSEQTVLGYVQSNNRLMDYQGDEIFMDVKSGKLYDFTIVTPPIPKGTYEVRVGYLTNGARGVCQFYFDNLPAGVPVNLNNYADNVAIGWVRPGSDTADPYGYENDKMMRNQGYMKGPACFTITDKTWTSAADARYDNRALRKILGIYEFTEDGTHLLTSKGLSSGQFMLDYLEFVPTSVIEFEDIY